MGEYTHIGGRSCVDTVFLCVGLRVGGAISMNPPAAAHKDFPPLPPAPDEPVELGDCEFLSQHVLSYVLHSVL